jgi:DNA-binding transcriptional regulator YhcF (GntR family)
MWISFRAFHLYEQGVDAVTKAIIYGWLRPGDGFASVRVLRRELIRNPFRFGPCCSQAPRLYQC